MSFDAQLARDRALRNARVITHHTPWDTARELASLLSHTIRAKADIESGREHPTATCERCLEAAIHASVMEGALGGPQ